MHRASLKRSLTVVRGAATTCFLHVFDILSVAGFVGQMCPKRGRVPVCLGIPLGVNMLGTPRLLCLYLFVCFPSRVLSAHVRGVDDDRIPTALSVALISDLQAAIVTATRLREVRMGTRVGSRVLN